MNLSPAAGQPKSKLDTMTESIFPSIDIPDVDLFGFLFEQIVPFPQNTVIYVDPLTQRQYTFGEVKRTATAFGNALRTKWNWQKGEVVGIFSANSIDMPLVIFGTLWANGVVSPANSAYNTSELAFQLSNSGAKALLTQAHLLKTAYEAAKIAGIPYDRVLVIGDVRDDRAVHFTDFIRSAEVTQGKLRIVQKASDLAFIPYSSGTTGLPKGVMLTQKNMVSNLLQVECLRDEITWNGGPDGKGDTLVGVLPFYHAYGLALLILLSIRRGVKLIVLPGFAPELFLKTIEQYKVTYAHIVPPIILFLSKSPIVGKYDLRSLRTIMSAAAPLATELVNDIYNRLRIPVKQGYGLSETSPATHVQRTEDWQSAIGSVGLLMPNMTAKYVSESGEALAAGSVGELWVKGPNIFAGYWKNDKATTNCMTSDGYFKTGDIGYQDKNGNFFITDRLKELIKFKGFQVPPAELEGLLVSYEKVADACVVGFYDHGQATEVPVAFVVKAEAVKHISDTVLEQDITDWVAGRVAHYKRLRGGVRFVDEIPKSAAGKILRRLLRDKLKAEMVEKASKPKL